MQYPSATEPSPSPFHLNSPDAYARWRERKLEAHPTALDALILELRDPRRLTPSERSGILQRCQAANMAIYVSEAGDTEDKDLVRKLGEQLGLVRLDHNRGADDDAITSLKVRSDDAHRGYIPYSNRPIAWHTDGYYNPLDRQIRAMVLHCVHPAATGGANALLDHEIAYILLRDRNPEYIRALMHPQAMTIPANVVEGRELRAEQSGPVFSVQDNGRLHMRYTDRKRNIVWRDDPLTTEALACLKDVLHGGSRWHFEARLEAGWGLVANNVLHTRTRFEDGDHPRLLYRARYYDRLSGT
jgi:hypothetical protein